MNNKKFEKAIKSKMDIPNKVPENINNLFDKFIDENVGSKETRNNVIKLKWRAGRKILTAAASSITTLIAGGIVYAAVTGNSVFDLFNFNINKEKYNEKVVVVNEEIIDNGISVNLENYAMDQNSIIVNYKIKSDTELQFSEEENIKVTAMANDNIHLKLYSQNYLYNSESNEYIVSTLYERSQFEQSINELKLNIEITNIAGREGNWNFYIDIGQDNISENRTYTFLGIQQDGSLSSNCRARLIDDIPLYFYVNYISVSDYSSMMDVEIHNYDKITRNRENERILVKISDNNKNTLYEDEIEYEWKNYDDDNMAWAHDTLSKKLLFPNFERDMNTLTIDLYSVNGENKEHIQTLVLELLDDYLEEDIWNLNKEVKVYDGKITLNISDKWDFRYNEKWPEQFYLRRVTKYGRESLLYFWCMDIDDDYFEIFGVEDNTNIQDVAEKEVRYHMKETIEMKYYSEIKNQGEICIGDYTGYQITWEELEDEDKDFEVHQYIYVIVDNKLCRIVINYGSEALYETDKAFYEEVLQSMKFKLD